MTHSSEESYAFIATWTPKSDVYAFSHGPGLLCLATAASAFYINGRFRRALKMRNFAYLTTMAGAVCIPAAMCLTAHHEVVTKALLLGKDRCPVCLDTRSSLTQVCSAVLHPLILSPLVCFPFASRYMTVAVPEVTQPYLLLQKYLSIVRPIGRRLFWLAAANFVLGAALANWERYDLLTVMEKVSHMETVVAEKMSADFLVKLKKDVDIAEKAHHYSDQDISPKLPDD